MAKKDKDAAEDAAPKKGMKEKLVPVALLLVGIVVGSKVLGGGSTTIVQAGEVPKAEAPSDARSPIVTLDPITLNLSDGHILKVGMALKLNPDPVKAAHAGDPSSGKDDPTKGYAAALNLAIATLGGSTMDQLITPDGRKTVQDELSTALAAETKEGIVGVYFWQFIVQ